MGNKIVQALSKILKNRGDLTLFRMGIFWWLLTDGGGQKATPPIPKICQTYPTMMKLGTVIPYLKKIYEKIYESCDTHPDSC